MKFKGLVVVDPKMQLVVAAVAFWSYKAASVVSMTCFTVFITDMENIGSFFVP